MDFFQEVSRKSIKRKRGRNPIALPAQLVSFQVNENIFLRTELAAKESVLGEWAKQPANIGAEIAVQSLSPCRTGQKNGCLLNIHHPSGYPKRRNKEMLYLHFKKN